MYQKLNRIHSIFFNLDEHRDGKFVQHTSENAIRSFIFSNTSDRVFCSKSETDETVLRSSVTAVVAIVTSCKTPGTTLVDSPVKVLTRATVVALFDWSNVIKMADPNARANVLTVSRLATLSCRIGRTFWCMESVGVELGFTRTFTFLI